MFDALYPRYVAACDALLITLLSPGELRTLIEALVERPTAVFTEAATAGTTDPLGAAEGGNNGGKG